MLKPGERLPCWWRWDEFNVSVQGNGKLSEGLGISGFLVSIEEEEDKTGNWEVRFCFFLFMHVRWLVAVPQCENYRYWQFSLLFDNGIDYNWYLYLS